MHGGIEAVVVNYNAGVYLERAVNSLIADGVDKVWIVDNASDDGSTAFVASKGDRVSVVRPGRNLGYGRGANLGFEKTDSRYLIVSNPDVEVVPGAVGALVRVLEDNHDCALVGPRIVNSDGTTYPSVRHFPSLIDAGGHAILGQVLPNNAFSKRYRMLGVDHTGSFQADWVSGAFIMVRSDVFKKVGGFSDKFFMYLEDVFLCRTIGDRGYQVRFCGQAVVRHVQGLTTGSRPFRMIFAHHKSLWTYAKLTKNGWRKIQLPLICIGILFRLSISLFLAFLGRGAKNHEQDLTK
ncbi:MAG: glycosyltransferase family 2 protein [Actinomycetota bacterium]|nr:glycosyltransferase family 2 protein [Actinomycetota bacterium]